MDENAQGRRLPAAGTGNGPASGFLSGWLQAGLHVLTLGLGAGQEALKLAEQGLVVTIAPPNASLTRSPAAGPARALPSSAGSLGRFGSIISLDSLDGLEGRELYQAAAALSSI